MLTRKLIAIILATLLILPVLPVTRQQSGFAGDGTNLPPQVIEIYPFPGTELVRETPLTISFDQPMNQMLTEQAFEFEPAVEGHFMWLDARTAQFTPTTAWPSNTSFNLTITTNATSQRGLTLPEPYTVTLHGATVLIVAEVSPSSDIEEVPTDAVITVSFNRPMIPLSTVDMVEAYPSPLEIEPAVSGTGQWINTALYQFTPDNGLFGGTAYTVTIEAGLSSVDGIVLPDDYQWSFVTEQPTIEYIYPTYSYYRSTPVSLDTPIEVGFSQPMHRRSTENAFTLYHHVVDENDDDDYEAVSGTFEWSEDGRVMTYRPDDLLAINTTPVCCNYVVVIEATARTEHGDGSLQEETERHFTTVTLPGVHQIRPGNSYEWRSGQTWLPGYYPVIQFNSPMNIDSLAGKIIIDPEPETWHPFTWNSYYGIDENISGELYLVFHSQAETTYTITILAGAEDPYGNEIEEDYVFTYTTTAQPAQAQTLWFTSLYSWGSRFQYTSAYREDTAYPLSVSGSPTLTFDLYNLSLENLFLEDIINDGMGTFDLPDDQLRRTWQATPGDPTYVNRTVSIPLASDEGGQLTPGVYGLEIHGLRDRYGARRPETKMLAVVTAHITVKRTPRGFWAWLVDIETGEPLAHTPVTIYDPDLNVYAELETNEVGVIQFDADFCTGQGDSQLQDCTYPKTYFIVVLDHDGQFSIATSNGEPPSHTRRATIYTDRPIYRPGDTVYFRGAFFNQNDMQYTAPANGTTVEVEATISYRSDRYVNEVIFNDDIQLTEFGTFSGAIELPDDMPLGNVRLYINGDAYNGNSYPLEEYGTLQPFFENYELPNEFYYYGMEYRVVSPSVEFKVAEYRTFDYELETNVRQDEIIQGDPINLEVLAQYYSGEPLDGAEIGFSSGGCLYRFDYQGAGNYRFYDEDWEDRFAYYYAYPPRYPDGRCKVFLINPELEAGEQPYSYNLTAETDHNGRASVEIDQTTYPHRQPTMIALTAFASDENRNFVSSQSIIIAHPATVYPGISTDSYSIELGEDLNYDLIAVTPQSEVIPNQTLTMTIDRITWQRIVRGGHYASYDWQRIETTAETVELSTDELGRASYTFRPSEPGSYRARVVAVDADGNTNTTTQRTYVRSYTWSGWWRPLNEDYQEIVPDKETYAPGETAHILLPLPTDGKSTVLIAVERSDVMEYDVIETEGSTLWYDLPITDAFAPTIHLNVTVIMPPDDEHPYARFNYGIQPIQIDPTPYRLNVALEAEPDKASPGETVTINARVTDRNGDPVVAEIGFKATDAAILDLLPDNNLSLEEAFYGPQWLHVMTYNVLEYLIDRFLAEAEDPQPGGMGGGAGPQTLQIRDDFEQTPLWEPHIVTDEEGRASVTFTLPDNLTRWEIEARVLTANGLVGQTTTSITSTRPIIVRPISTRFFTVGDHVMLSSTVHNNTDAEQVIAVHLNANGVTLDDSALQTIILEANTHQRVDWWAVVEDVGFVSLEFSAESETGYQDAAVPTLTTGPDNTIPVYRFTSRSVYGTGGVLMDETSVVEGVSVPSRLADGISGELVINLEPSIAAATVDTLDYLNHYPHLCVEQTTSRFLPNVVTYRALNELEILDSSLRANLLTNRLYRK